MAAIPLVVPFHEKEAAKRLGAKWNATSKVWFVPDGVDASPFGKWRPESHPFDESRISIRSSFYYIAQSSRRCWKCQRDTAVFGLLLPPGHEQFTRVPDPDLGTQNDRFFSVWVGAWVPQDLPCILTYVTELPEPVRYRMSSETSFYRLDFSETTRSLYWMNHCQYCGMKQGDFDTIEEFDSPLCPAEPEDLNRIGLIFVDQPICAGADSMDYEPEYFEQMVFSGDLLPNRKAP